MLSSEPVFWEGKAEPPHWQLQLFCTNSVRASWCRSECFRWSWSSRLDRPTPPTAVAHTSQWNRGAGEIRKTCGTLSNIVRTGFTPNSSLTHILCLRQSADNTKCYSSWMMQFFIFLKAGLCCCVSRESSSVWIWRTVQFKAQPRLPWCGWSHSQNWQRFNNRLVFGSDSTVEKLGYFFISWWHF